MLATSEKLKTIHNQDNKASTVARL